MKQAAFSRAGRKPRFDEPRRELYIRVLATSGVIGEAMAAAGISSRATLKSARENVDGFAEREEEALQAAADSIEAIADARAKFGHEVPVLNADGTAAIDRDSGQPRTVFVPPSERLLLARLKALKPERYGTDRHLHTGQVRSVTTLYLPVEESAAQFEKLLEAARAKTEEEADKFLVAVADGEFG
jgi:hypothetical protein